MNNPRQKARHSADMIFVLVLFAFLVLTGLLLISMGTGVFEQVLSNMNRNDRTRTASAYILQKVRQNQDAGAIQTGNLDGYPAVQIRQNIDGQDYTTWLYCDGIHLKELLARSDNDSLRASAGSDILELKKMAVSEEEGSILVTLTDTEDGVQTVRVSTSP